MITKLLLSLPASWLALVLLLHSQAACQTATAPAASPAQKPAAANAVPAWRAMSKNEKRKYMKEVVSPKMKELFVAFDGKRYEEMDCRTCHGEAASEGKFKMPNPLLPKLPTDDEGLRRLAAEKLKTVEFMNTKIKPTMAQLLGMPEYSPQNPDGMGCMSCHTPKR